jgi:hypothetical protein
MAAIVADDVSRPIRPARMISSRAHGRRRSLILDSLVNHRSDDGTADGIVDVVDVSYLYARVGGVASVIVIDFQVIVVFIVRVGISSHKACAPARQDGRT